MITLIKLYYFLETAKTSSFSEAAKKLYTTQPNISKQISLLEKELNTNLFVRDKGQIYLTRAGQYLFSELKNMPDKVEKACREAAAIGRKDENKLRIGIFRKAVGYEIHMALLRFAEEHKDITFDVEREEYDYLCNDFLEMRYDMIITDEAYLPVYQGRAEKMKLFDITLAAAVSTRNPLSSRKSVSLRELADEPYVIRLPKNFDFCSDQLRRVFEEAGFEPKVARYVTSLDSLFIYTGLNEGITIVEENHGMLNSPDLKLVHLEPPVSLPVYALWDIRRSDGLPSQIAEWLIACHKD